MYTILIEFTHLNVINYATYNEQFLYQRKV